MNFHFDSRRARLLALSGLVLFAVLFVAGVIWQQNKAIQADSLATQNQEKAFALILPRYQQLVATIKADKAQGVDVASVEPQRLAILAWIQAGNFTKADEDITTTLALLDKLLADKLAADAALRGTVSGKVSADTGPLASVALTLLMDTQSVATTTTSATGDYSFTIAAGSYTLKAIKSGYATYSKAITITAQQTLTLAITMTKAVAVVATPKPTSTVTTSSASSTAYTTYELKTVTTSVGSFSAHVLTADIGAGKARMLTDTASDSDCTDNCPTLSLSSYVGRNGGIAGINGTYFCPADYSACAGKVNTFFYRIYNSRLHKLINQFVDDGQADPVLVIKSDGSPKYYAHWTDYAASGTSVTAAINSGPALVQGGQGILNVSKLDDKQRYTKSNRGALGLKGSTLYAVIGKSATVVDMEYIMAALGVDSAMGLDGGGSSALYYKGGYKVGPGRSLPNAVVIAE
jgi:exopolysaccharide biosynthesis protein